MPTEAQREPRWVAVVALIAVGWLYMALPSWLSVGPRWALLVTVAVLLVPTIGFRRAGKMSLNRIFGFLVNGVVTAAVIWSVITLVLSLPQHKEPPVLLLRSAGSLWIANVLIFALWYWQLDAGGPNARSKLPGHTEGAFLFPQMVPGAGEDSTWSPHFIDYMFLAFNTSTALSPTDAPVLSRWAKGLMMVQSFISLTIVILLAARAVNIL
jgi:hypothetical protein